jgi:hypothetical protein
MMGAILGDGAEEKLWPGKGWMSTGGEEEGWDVETLERSYDGNVKGRRDLLNHSTPPPPMFS